MGKNKKTKYLNEFPIIIIVAIIIIIIILAMMYLRIKPHEIIYKNGYMVLSNNMTYNLINDDLVAEKDELSIGVASVANGDYVYKQMDSYYVGVEKKIEVDYDYPLYSKDGLTIYNLNENAVLVNRNFEKIDGYPGLSLNYGILYNDGDTEPADDIDYLFLDLNNSIYINTQVMVIKTVENEYSVPVHSPIHFDTNYINYYVFDGKTFGYNAITDIYYDSLVKIGDVTLTYNEFLVQMGLVKLDDFVPEIEDDNASKDDDNDSTQTDVEEKKENDGTLGVQYVKPSVSISNFISSVYFVQAELAIKDTAGVITENPTFEIYTSDDKLYSRKKFSESGEMKISGLSSDTQYKIIGTYKYKNEKGLSVENTFYETVITTKDISFLEEIKIESDLGNIYSNKIEIKDMRILNNGIEAVSGIKRIVLNVWKETENKDDAKKVDLSYSEIKKLTNGEKVTVSSPKNLSSNTVYEYSIEIYDKDNNELKYSGNINGKIKTSKEEPSIKATVSRDAKNNIVDIDVKIQNKDNVYIKDFNYQLYDYAGYLIDEGSFDYNHDKVNKLSYNELDYNKNYILRVSGIYDSEDGKGERDLIIEKDFTTANLSSKFVAWYDESTLNVTFESMEADIYISSNTVVLEKNNTKLLVYLTDKDGNKILDKDGNLKYFKEYSKEEYSSVDGSEYYVKPLFEDLDSGIEYKIAIDILVKQMEKDITITQYLEPSIKTKFKEAYLTVINKKLIGGNLDVNLEINDQSNYINSNSVIIEIYEGKYSSKEELRKVKYIHRERISLLEDQTTSPISLSLGNYTGDSYTIAVISNPYNNIPQDKYLTTNIGTPEEKELINVSKGMDAYVEMYQQQYVGGSLNTELSFEYNLFDTVDDIYFIDCDNLSCTNLGYIDSTGIFNQVSKRFKGISINSDNKKIVTIDNNATAPNHQFYIAVLKDIVNIKTSETINKNIMKRNMYVLDSLEYNTAYSIYNINHASDFFDTTLIKKDNEVKHYVVTDNISFGNGDTDLNNLISSAYFTNFNGVIDFQGYNVDLYNNDINSVFSLFSSVGKDGILKNVVLNYNLNYEGSVSSKVVGFVSTNSGTLENFVVNVRQKYEGGKGLELGLLAHTNNGTINNFVIYLQTNISVYSHSSLVTWLNNSTGVISNGYVRTAPGQNTVFKIKIYDLIYKGYGTFINENYGTIKNVYNLINVELQNSDTDPVATIVRMNRPTGVIRNVISEATSSNYDNAKGPNIWTNSGGEISNNYYVDTNQDNASYTNNYNTQINQATLMNASAWEVILNSDNCYSITSGYYPILKMNKFMYDKQELVNLKFNYYENSIVDILSTEVLNNNIESDTARVKVYISNPNKSIIDEIVVDGLTSEINQKETIYDENMQATILTLNLKLSNENDIAKSNYYITDVVYRLNESEQIQSKVSYDAETNPRILYVDMYRRISNYADMVKAINADENIYLTENIIADVDSGLPKKSMVYSGIFDGGEKTLDFDNKKISRGYFFYGVSGTLKNLNAIELNFDVEVSSGFIANAINASIFNVNVSDVNMNINIKSNTSNIYIGSLVAHASYSNFYKTSSNNITITRDDASSYYSNSYRIGGLVGYSYYGEIQNSYVYNIQVTDSSMKKINASETYELGGIVGNGSNSNISHCYSTGEFDVEYSKTGGIIGNFHSTYVTGNYSYMKIKTTGDYVGGIAGHSYSSHENSISDNMFIGQLINRNSNSNISLISTSYSNKLNYTLVPTSNTTLITSPYNLTEFDSAYASFEENTGSMDLPYLKETSFVNQEIKGKMFINFDENDIKYLITYHEDDNSSCKVNDISNVNNEEESINSNLYEHACASSATLNITNGYTLDYEFVEQQAKTEDLIITQNNDGTYTLKPLKYLNYYKLNVRDANGTKQNSEIDVKFFRQIKTKEDWNSIKDSENIILVDDISLNSSDAEVSSNKNIYNFLGNGKKIQDECSDSTLACSPNNLISLISGTMRDVTFDGFAINSESEMTSIIKSNEGIIENCKFSNINITSTKDKTAIISTSNGLIKNINLSNIEVKGAQYTAALVGYNSSGYINKVHIQDINALGENQDNIKIEGTDYVGGIVGFADYTIQNIKVSGETITGNSYVGGIIGNGSCKDSSVSNATFTVSGSYVGGIGVQKDGATLSNLAVSNIQILDANPDGDVRQHIGGVYANGWYFTNIQVEDLEIGTLEKAFNANYVGAIGSRSGRIENSSVKNSIITGKNHIGGLIGQTLTYTPSIKTNLVLNSYVVADNRYAGGLIGSVRNITENQNTNIQDNIVTKTLVGANSVAGGLIGYLDNSNTIMQNISFSDNLDTGVTVYGTQSGGILGALYQVPASSEIKYETNLFYGNDGSGNLPLIGTIKNKGTGLSTGYGNVELDEETFANKSNFKEYVNKDEKKEYQINSVSDLETFIQENTTAYKFVHSDENYYFPVFNDTITNQKEYLKIENDDYVEITYDSGIGTLSSTQFSMLSSFKNYSLSYKNSINVDYNVYASGVNKVNIEFNNVDSNVYFYYKIGNYISSYIPLNKRTYTITYDFKNPINIYVTNGINYKDSEIKPEELAKTVSIVDGITYYINNNSLYSESKMITGNFKNLYGNEALTDDGKIYNIKSKEEIDAYIDYNVSPTSVPLYEFAYEGNSIKTYYNYSTVNDVEKDYQLFVKNGNLNSISSFLNNKKNMYIIDYYNSNEIQIVLKNDGKLYNIKHNINYPNNIINKGISELYTNVNSTDTIAVLKYTNGAVYTFNYRTGEVLFTNVSNKDISFLDYIKNKVGGNSEYNVIENISGHDKYNEIDLLKNKINDLSLDEAKDKIYNSNISMVDDEEYVTMYNELTKNYDVYKVSSLVNDYSDVESETEKMYKNYELVYFYNTLGKSQKKNSLSGIIIFTISIISVLISLALLIKHKLNKKGGVA